MILDGNGNDVSTNYAHIANVNPIRYRGYYYDIESSFYYLNSRYYDPEIGRFINADATNVLTATPMGLTDKNLFAYCDNNPVTRVDDGGEFWHIVAGGVVGGILSAVATVITGGSVEEVIVSAICGAASGALTAALPGAGLLIDVGFGFLEEMTVSAIKSKDVKKSVGDSAISAGVDMVSGLMDDGTRSTKETLKEFSKAIPKTLKGNHPKVKSSAKQIVRRTSKTMGREIGETVASKTIGNFFKNIFKAIF